MSSAIRDILPLAGATALSPAPIIAVILILSAPSARRNGGAFVLGWTAGLVAVGTIVLLLSRDGSTDAPGSPSTTSSVVRLAIGLLALGLAARAWRARPARGAVAEMPRWMQRIDGMGPAACLGLGALLAGVNPKNLGLTVAAARRIAQAGLGGGEEAITLAVFAAAGTVGVMVPVTLYLLLGARAAGRLERWKTWLSGHNAVVTAVVLAIIGIVLAANAVGDLA